MTTVDRAQKRITRHRRVRAKVIGTSARPRLCVYKSNTRLVAQIIDDEKGVTIAHVSSAGEKGGTPQERAVNAAATLAKQAKDKGVDQVVFDRGGFQYIGTIRSFADALRAAGIIF